MKLRRPLGRTLRQALVGLALGAAILPAYGGAAEVSRNDVAAALAEARAAGHPADFAGRSLRGLDLSSLDLSSADLSGADLSDADLRRTKLAGAKLVGARLPRARLNLAWIMSADFSQADLTEAVLETLVVSEGLEVRPDEATRFVGAILAGARVTARFHLADMRGADFSGLKASADMRNQSMGLIRTEFTGARLTGADFSDAELGRVDFKFAKLQGADFTRADLTRADFAGADLTGADFTGAITTGTVFDSADLTGVTGLAEQP